MVFSASGAVGVSGLTACPFVHQMTLVLTSVVLVRVRVRVEVEVVGEIGRVRGVRGCG